MGAARSLAARVLVGAVLWTLGLLLVASALLAAVMEHGGHAALLIHGALGHTAAVVVLSLALLAAGAWQVRSGLASVARLRARLMDVRQGLASRVEGRYPSEVQPLVDDLNDLIDVRERMVRRAQARAGDLAHGLKTPLAILVQDVERAAIVGPDELANSVRQQTARMQRQIEYHLAQARTVASGGGSAVVTTVATAASALATTLARLHAGRDVAIDVLVPPTDAVRCEREDLDEMLGNLMDNACKWARSRVVVSSARAASELVIAVDDDGPGFDLSRQAVLARGVRLDESVPGSGLGLAIVREIADLYGGSLRLDRSPLGGVTARLALPSAPHDRAGTDAVR